MRIQQQTNMLGKKGYHIFFLDDIMKIITDNGTE